MPLLLDAFLSQEETISVQEFLARRESAPASVRGAKFDSPRPGEKSFGHFVVRRKSGVYEVTHDRKRSR